ncbi:GAF domain-containing sensor histidine kinase [Reichenbachiella ulvae]|uniref:histidine kinase n=1 Tax=Reichenbachiella ulvae TaxID=2980104 RepID=A0ABT3CTX4_9BACT|nr:ATP-binding protein [Reichenbachiella ulvae]MCV9387156.1 ATP-binding protein [Reichenbachiella ulvae]
MSETKSKKDSELIKLRNQIKMINEIVSSDTYNLGDRFFETTVKKLNSSLDADYTFIGKVDPARIAIETIAITGKDQLLDNFTYLLHDTPCENVVGQTPCSYPEGITTLFPKDQLLIDMGIEGYVGVPLYDSKSNPTGIIVCLYKKPIEEVYAKESILMIFASRAGAELEHMKLFGELEQNKKELEKKVFERTKELKKKNDALQKANEELKFTLQQLKSAQTQLVQSEKMASLGVLTSGVAHEINNPLNFIRGGYLGLKKELDVYHKDETINKMLECIGTGVDRATGIVKGLNQFSRSNDSHDEQCDLHTILDNCLIMMQNQLKHSIIVEKRFASEPIFFKSNVGQMHQVFINIFTNAIQAIDKKGLIQISTRVHKKMAEIEIIDNGCGIVKDNLPKVTDPFFTTKEAGIGTGLGLSITLSIIQSQNGKLKIDSEVGQGTRVNVSFPMIK